MTLFKPGHKPPQVTTAATVFAGSKWICSRAPAFSKDSPGLSSSAETKSAWYSRRASSGVKSAMPSPRSVESFNELWLPYYEAINGWVHRNTNWKTLKHSCGSVARFYPSFIEAGFDIINPVQCSAAGMDPEVLKSAFGDRLVFWGGGVDTQKTLPFGKPGEVREEVLRRLEVFSPNGGYVFNAVHNIQARTPVANVVAMLEAVREFHGRPRTGVHSD